MDPSTRPVAPAAPLPLETLGPLLAAARGGSTQALGQLLELCRCHLLGVAQREIDPKLRAKAGASDMVQDAFVEAQRIFDRFQGRTVEELLAWLRAILLNKLADFTVVTAPPPSAAPARKWCSTGTTTVPWPRPD